MTKSKPIIRRDVSMLQLRLWEFTGTAFVNLFVFALLLGYLFPLSYTLLSSLETDSQFLDHYAPIWPAKSIIYTYLGQEDDVYYVPTADGVRQLALVKALPTKSDFIDPKAPEAGLVHWQGSWRTLRKVYVPSITFDNFIQAWKSNDYQRYFGNTMFVALVSGIGVLCSSIAVAYGMSRFRIPGGGLLFLLIIATIMIPDSILMVPSFYFYGQVLHWFGSYLPLVVPSFFGSAVYIFLLRQKFKSIPRDLDEAAMLDGAGPLRILISIILPQSIPIVATVALLHFFNMWNELRLSSLYLSSRHDLQLMAFSIQTTGSSPAALQTDTLFFMLIPVIVLLVSQRFFMQDMIVTGIEK
jgi:multiple sugar transport system permease protein